MTVSTDQHAKRAQGATVTLEFPAWSCLGQLQEHTGLSPAELANCALTWYAYFDTQLRAGYRLTLWSAETGKAHTLSLATDLPAPAEGSCRTPAGRVPHFTDSSSSWARQHHHCRPPPSPVFTALRPWASRASPAALPPQGESQASQPFRHQTGRPGT